MSQDCNSNPAAASGAASFWARSRGLAAWIVEKFKEWSDCGDDLERSYTKGVLSAAQEREEVNRRREIATFGGGSDISITPR